MCLSNGSAGRLIANSEFNVKAATDVTGFGLMGHLAEMLGGGVGAKIDVRKVPIFEGALEAARQGVYSSLQESNESARRVVANHGSTAKVLPLHSKLLYDPQTSGGLIIVVAEEDEGKILVELKKFYPDACAIGKIVEEEEIGGIGAEEVEGTCTVKKLVKLEF